MTVSFESQFAVQGSQFPIWKEATFKTFLKALNINFFGIMEWDIKVFSDLLNWQERTLTRHVWASFPRDCTLDLSLRIFSGSHPRNKIQLFIYLGNNSIGYVSFGVICNNVLELHSK